MSIEDMITENTMSYFALGIDLLTEEITGSPVQGVKTAPQEEGLSRREIFAPGANISPGSRYAETTRISGQLLDQYGNPISGAVIGLANEAPEALDSSRLTDDNGAYEFDVSVDSDSPQALYVYYEGKRYGLDGTEISLEPDVNVYGKRLVQLEPEGNRYVPMGESVQLVKAPTSIRIYETEHFDASTPYTELVEGKDYDVDREHGVFILRIFFGVRGLYLSCRLCRVKIPR